jgi:hypothetical protein
VAATGSGGSAVFIWQYGRQIWSYPSIRRFSASATRVFHSG